VWSQDNCSVQNNESFASTGHHCHETEPVVEQEYITSGSNVPDEEAMDVTWDKVHVLDISPSPKATQVQW